jgi:predicted AlkP superfamily pyrophosphatase or phosphodiesterase
MERHAPSGARSVCVRTASPLQVPISTSLRAIVLSCIALALAACAPRPKSETYSPLILISFDGYRADYLDRGLSPHLAALAADGVRAEAMRPSFPTLTFPNHYTIVTGLYPDHHGIVHNRMVDPVSERRFVYSDRTTTGDPSWWGGEPVWVSLERHGRHAATMFWPGSDVAIEGVLPEHWLPYDGHVTPQARVDQALAWLDLPPAQRPDFVTLYFEQVDHANHQAGPDTSEVDDALREVDAALGRLLAGLRARGIADTSNIVIVSDHGGTASGADRVVVLDRIVPIADIDLINTGVLAGFAPKRSREDAVERAVLRPHDHMRCWRRSEVPTRLHYGTNPRIPPLLCLADDGWLIFTQKFMDDPKQHVSRGEHGYDNDDPRMRALFVAHGPAFRRGLVAPEFDNVDVYPLLMHVLGLQPQPNDGDFATVAGMLAAEHAAR